MRNRQSSTRSERNQRYDGKRKKKKVDRVLNGLIAIVSILIILNLISVFTDDENDNEQAKELTKDINERTETQDTQQTEEEPKEAIEKVKKELEAPTTPNDTSQKEVQILPDDPMVQEVVINGNWQVTPTKQQGEHISSYEEGHIDYEEKLHTFRNAVQLEEDNIIYWSVKNNGGPNSAVAVVSSKDAEKSQKYRISIEWIENEGWKPVKVEKLNELTVVN